MTDEPTRQPYQGLVSKTVIVLRWLLFVPAGLAGGVVVSIIWGAFGAFAYWFYGWSTPQASPWSPASKMGNSFLCGYAMVAIGCFRRPNDTEGATSNHHVDRCRCFCLIWFGSSTREKRHRRCHLQHLHRSWWSCGGIPRFSQLEVSA
jgi:hypothetical protein